MRVGMRPQIDIEIEADGSEEGITRACPFDPIARNSRACLLLVNHPRHACLPTPPPSLGVHLTAYLCCLARRRIACGVMHTPTRTQLTMLKPPCAPSTTFNSGHGQQGFLDDQVPTQMFEESQNNVQKRKHEAPLFFGYIINFPNVSREFSGPLYLQCSFCSVLKFR